MKLIFSDVKRFKRKLINEIIQLMVSSGFVNLKTISDPNDFQTESICFQDFCGSLKISISGNRHQFYWNIKIDDKDIINKIISRLMINKYKVAGVYSNTETIETFIKVVNEMITQVNLIKTEVKNFLSQHGKEIQTFQGKIDKEINEFLNTLQ